MGTRSFFLLAVSFACVASLPAMAGDRARKQDKGAFLGVLFGPRTDKLVLPKPTPLDTTEPANKVEKQASNGVVVTHVLPDSPASKIDLRRGDVLLAYDHKAIRDGDHLAQLIRDDKPARKVHLVYQRGKRVRSVETTLALGPALKLFRDRGTEDNRAPTPGQVSVVATPLESGKMKVTIEYNTAGKMQTLSCGGTATELASTVQKLPLRERNLVRVALQRLRSLDILPAHTESSPPVKR